MDDRSSVTSLEDISPALAGHLGTSSLSDEQRLDISDQEDLSIPQPSDVAVVQSSGDSEAKGVLISVKELDDILAGDQTGAEIGVNVAQRFLKSNGVFEPALVKIAPGKGIPPERSPTDSILGLVLSTGDEGLRLNIGGVSTGIGSGDHFLVPPCVSYSLDNLSTEDHALVKFLISN